MLSVRGLKKVYPRRSLFEAPVTAVHDVSFELERGGSLALIGESGSGKTTVARMVSRLLEPTAGVIQFEGLDIASISPGDFVQRPERRHIQYVFQDAGDSLTPHFKVFDAIADPLRRLLGGKNVEARVHALAEAVALPKDLLGRYPHQLSGGQKARVGIARALAPDPRLLILDEPTASLDVSVQAAILKLLDDLRARFGLTYLLITHDLEVVRLMCPRLVIMRQGEIVEAGDTAAFLRDPRSDYGRMLLAALPQLPRHDTRDAPAKTAVMVK